MRITSLLTASALILLTAACTPKISDTLDKFATGINENDVDKVKVLISEEADDYAALSNNDWSGLSTQIAGWSANAPYKFSGLTETIDGDTADVECTAEMSTGDKPGYFKLVLKSSFFSKAWKIKQWKIDAANDGFVNDSPRITRPVP